MNTVIENSLYKNNPTQFHELRKCAKEFGVSYIGNNIIQDDIFSVIRNFAEKNGKHLELIKLPIKDDDFCAFTCIRAGEIFTVLNSSLPLCKQIYAVAHELYHIWCYISDLDDTLTHSGSLLTADHMDDDSVSQEDMEANAFAALLLVPSSALMEQMDVYDLDRKNISLNDVVKLMDIFAVPFKAMVLRLLEESILDEHTADQLIKHGTDDNLSRSMSRQNIALRWQKRTHEVDMGLLSSLLQLNQEEARLPDKRINEDQKYLDEMITRLLGK